MKLLVVTVGTGRVREDVAQAMAFGVETMQPDRVLFLTSEKTEIETYPLVEANLGDAWAGKIEAHCFPNEDDAQLLFVGYVERIRRKMREIESGEGTSTLWVDFTTGTKAMTAALFAAGIALEASKVCYVIGDRDTTGRVIKSDNVKQIEPQLVLAERAIAEARQLFNQQDYAAAAKSIALVKTNFFPKGSHLRDIRDTIFALGEAYAAWNRFDWKTAAKMLTENRKVFRRESNVVDPGFLDEQAAFCARLEKGDYDPARLVDLFSNATRCVNEKRYDDAMSRLYRAFEYSIQIRLRSEFGIDTSNFRWKEFESRLCEATNRQYENAYVPIKIGLREAIELSAELGDEIGLALVKDYWNNWTPGMAFMDGDSGSLQGYLKRRNDSFLAHGTKPIERTVVTNLLNRFEKFLRMILEEAEFDKLLRLATFIRI